MIKLIVIGALMAIAIHMGCKGFDTLQATVQAETAAFHSNVEKHRSITDYD